MKRFLPLLVGSGWTDARLQFLDVYGKRDRVSRATLPDPFVPQPYRVAACRRESADVATLELAPVAGERAGLPARPVQHAVCLRRRRSGDQHERRSGGSRVRFVHTVRDVGAVSGAIAKLGSRCDARGARTVRHRVADRAGREGSDVVIVAGGLGLAPLRPAIYQVLANRGRYGRVVRSCTARAPRPRSCFGSELERWRRRLDVEVAVTVDHADRDLAR